MATVFNFVEVGTAEVDLFNAEADGGSVSAIEIHGFVSNPEEPLLINVPDLHGHDQWYPIVTFNPPTRFECGRDGIHRVRAKSSVGTVRVVGGVVKKVDTPVPR